MKHPKRFCVTCDRQQLLTISDAMYHCRQCGEEVCRVGDGDTAHGHLTVRGGVDGMSLSEDVVASANLTDLALGNPDILSDEHAMWQPRNIETEEAREDMLRTFKTARRNLTARQAQILSAVNDLGSQEAAARSLGVSHQLIAGTLNKIEKKLTKLGCYPRKQGLIGKHTL